MNDEIIKSYKEKNIYIDHNCKIGENVVIYPNNFLEGNCIIENNVILMPNNYIKNSILKKGCKVSYSVIEDSFVNENTTIGPFSHLRPYNKIGKNVKIGNFVEVKNSIIENKTKISHLSYVGDADVGQNVNIGCGVVFVNFTGKTKHRSKVCDNSFIGSSVNLIAPVRVGKEAFICAGTTIDKDVNDGDFVIGRSKMCVKEGRAKNYLKGDN